MVLLAEGTMEIGTIHGTTNRKEQWKLDKHGTPKNELMDNTFNNF